MKAIIKSIAVAATTAPKAIILTMSLVLWVTAHHLYHRKFHGGAARLLQFGNFLSRSGFVAEA